MNTIKENTETKSLYPFLNIYKEREAILMGVNFSNRYIQDLFKHIEKLSTPINAGKSQLFNTKKSNTDHIKALPEDLIAFLNKLIGDKLIIQIVGLEYELDLRMIIPSSYYIAHPPPEKGSSIDTLFERVMANSSIAIKNWLEQRHPFPVEPFKLELEGQFANPRSSLKNDFSIPIVDVKKLFYAKKYDAPVKEEIIDFVAKELAEEAVRTKRAVLVPGHGILLLKTSELLPYFEATADFINQKIIPSLKTDVKLAHTLNKINYEELDYNLLESKKPKTTRFISKKVKEIKNKKIKYLQSPEDPYPGSLAIEIILALESVIEKRYVELWNEESYRIKEEFKEGINRITEKWENLFRAIEQTEALNYPPDVWRDLVNDKEIFYTKWETDFNTMHIFIGREPVVIKKLVNNMLDLPSKEFWKALALRSIIDQNELELKKLLDDEFFLSDYGNLLRKVYIHIMPWYYKGLFLFPIKLLKDLFFNKAKEILNQQQERYALENKQRMKDHLAEKEKEKSSKLLSEMENMIYTSLLEKLDQIYFVDKTIPHIGAIKSMFPEVDSKNFMDMITKRNFRLIPIGQKYSREYDILLYPVDKDWQEKKIGIMNYTRQTIEKLSETFLNEADRLTLVKARKLKTFLEKTSTNPEISVAEKSKDDDPYQKLEKEIKNLKAKEKRKDDVQEEAKEES